MIKQTLKGVVDDCHSPIIVTASLNKPNNSSQLMITSPANLSQILVILHVGYGIAVFSAMDARQKSSADKRKLEKFELPFAVSVLASLLLLLTCVTPEVTLFVIGLTEPRPPLLSVEVGQWKIVQGHTIGKDAPIYRVYEIILLTKIY